MITEMIKSDRLKVGSPADSLNSIVVILLEETALQPHIREPVGNSIVF